MRYLTLILLSIALTACNSGNDLVVSDDDPMVSINSASHSGAGCPSGTGDIILSSDKRTLSVLFDEFQAVAGVGTEVTKSRVACSIAVSLHVPSGYQVFLIGADFRGSVSLPPGAGAEFDREYFFASARSPILTARWSGEVDNDNIEIFDDLYAESDGYSPCGQDVILRSNTSLYVTVPDANSDTALIQIDSLDYANRGSKTQFDYQFNYARCR